MIGTNLVNPEARRHIIPPGRLLRHLELQPRQALCILLAHHDAARSVLSLLKQRLLRMVQELLEHRDASSIQLVDEVLV